MASSTESAIDTVTQRAKTWPERARSLQIVDDGTYLLAAETLKGIKSLRAEVDATFDGIISKAHAAHREACSQKKAAEMPLIEAEQVIKRAMGAFDEAQERARREEQRRLEEAERRRIEEDRINLAAHMEREGKAFGDDAMVQEAHELIEQPIVTTVAPPARTVPKVAGVSMSDVWKHQVINERAVPREYLMVNEKAIGAVVRNTKGQVTIPGVRIWKERGVSASSK